MVKMIGGDEILMGQKAQELFENLPNRVSDKVQHWIKNAPNKQALVDKTRSWTYGDLGKAVQIAKEHLINSQVREGDRLMLVIENCCSVVAFILAASEMNIWVAIINARMASNELAQITNDCMPRHTIYFHQLSNDAKRHAENINAQFASLEMLGDIAFKSNLSATAARVEEKAEEQVCAMIYTSGTTGTPKGVLLTHRNIGFIASISGAMRGLNYDDRVYVVLPISHVFGFASTCMGSLFAGATLYMEPRFDVETCLTLLKQERITVFQAVPPMYSVLTEALKAKGIEASDLNLRYMSVGGAPLDPETKKLTESFFQMPLHNGYGLTETSPTVSQVRLNQDLKNCSVGQVIPGVEIKLMGQNAQESAKGEIGELWVRGPNVMKGYYQKPVETDAVKNKEGWFNTQDLAQIDEDGNLNIVGRTKEMIVRSGFNVYPAEVEATLNEHDLVTQSAVVGVSIKGDEDVHAYIQVQEGSNLSIEEIKQHCKENLTGYKRPSKIILLNALPSSATGKILKHKLKEMSQQDIQ